MEETITKGVDVYPVLIFLGTALAVAGVLRPFKVSPVLGYLLAGALIGPSAFALIDDVAQTRALAELGVVFLLFTIGLELPIDRLRVMRGLVFGLGGLQVLTTGLAIGAITYYLLGEAEMAIIIGGALALSSTALVLQLLVERGDLSTLYGRASFSTLLFQDLAVAPLLVVVTTLGSQTDSLMSQFALALVNSVLVVVIVFLAGRLLLRPVFRLIDGMRNPEMFTAASLFIVLATAALSHHFGLSMALGGFLAGILLAESEYRHQVAADIQPFRELLLGLFFMTVGMAIDINQLMDNAALVLALTAGLMVLKAVILYGLARSFGKAPLVATRYSLMLSQSGEFAFVLLGLAAAKGLIFPGTTQLLFLVVALTMLVTPFISMYLFPVIKRWEDRQREAQGEEEAPTDMPERTDHVIIAGYGRVGRTVARVLDAEGASFVAIDLDHDRIAKARARGRPVFYGNALRLPVWRSISAHAARAVVIAIEDPALVSRIVGLLHKEFPHLKIFVRARDAEHAEELKAAGATDSIPITFQASLELGASVLKSMGGQAEDITQVVEFLKNRYEDEDDVEGDADEEMPEGSPSGGTGR